MDFIKDISRKLTETAKVAAKKSSEMVEVTKLNMNIGSEEDKISKAYAEMGKMVCESFEKGEEIPESFKELCEKVSGIKENISKMKQQILKLKNIKICPSCGTELECEVAYCSKCGTKQEIILPDDKDVAGKEEPEECMESEEEIVSKDEDDNQEVKEDEEK